MTKAADDLKTWAPSEAKASSKWREQFAKNFKNGTYAAFAWNGAAAKAKSELEAELKVADSDQKDYEKLLSAFHDDAKGRMANILSMVKALGDDKTATPQLVMQAKTYCKELITDLADPVDGILKQSARALQGNRLDLMTDADIEAAAKINKSVPVDDLKLLLKEFKKSRKALIDASNETTRNHTDKIKTFRQRALDALKMVEKLEGVANENREGTKADLKKEIWECIDYFESAEGGNFLKPTTQLRDLHNLAEQVAGRDKQAVSDALVKVGGKDRVAGYLILTSKKYNEWKVQEKKIDLLDVYCQKVKNDTATSAMKELKKLSAENKKVGQDFKAEAEAIAKAWTDTASLRTT